MAYFWVGCLSGAVVGFLSCYVLDLLRTVDVSFNRRGSQNAPERPEFPVLVPMGSNSRHDASAN